MPKPKPINTETINSNTYELFYYDNSPLSNMYFCNIVIDGNVYPSAEHAYQCAKFSDKKIIEYILEADAPIEAKYRAHSYKDHIREDWDIIRLRKMYDIVFAKIIQNSDILEYLINTKDKILIETSAENRDDVWGMIESAEVLEGSNFTGRILMGIRKKLVTGA